MYLHGFWVTFLYISKYLMLEGIALKYNADRFFFSMSIFLKKKANSVKMILPRNLVALSFLMNYFKLASQLLAISCLSVSFCMR